MAIRGRMSIWEFWALPYRYRAVLEELLRDEDREIDRMKN